MEKDSMNEEEKKAIECLKNRLEILHNNTQWATENSIKIVLNLIEKQQNEIEELKKDNEEQWEHRCKMAIELDNNVVSKDKIREKIKELSKTQAYKVGLEEYTIKILRELLEE